MNKLTALYAMFKKVQEKESINALISAEGKLDETVVATMSGEIVKNAQQCEKRMELKFGEETLKFERSGKKTETEGCCGHGHHHHHRGHGEGHRGCCPSSKLDKAMFMLKMLDQTEYVENNDGTSSFTLNVAFEDLPEKLQEHLKQRGCKMHEHGSSGCCEKFSAAHEWLASCGCMDLDCASIKPKNIKITINLKADKSPEKVNVAVCLQAKDQAGGDRVLTLKAEGQCQ